MYHDPIVEEIHQAREKILAEVGDDWDALLKHFQRNNHLHANRLVSPAEPRKQAQNERAPELAESA